MAGPANLAAISLFRPTSLQRRAPSAPRSPSPLVSWESATRNPQSISNCASSELALTYLGKHPLPSPQAHAI